MIIDSEHPDRQPIAVPSRIGQGTVQIMLGRMVLFASGYFVAMLLARRLGPAEYGLYGIILSVVLWIEAIGDFGIPEAATKLIPEDENRAPCRKYNSNSPPNSVFVSIRSFLGSSTFLGEHLPDSTGDSVVSSSDDRHSFHRDLFCIPGNLGGAAKVWSD